VFAGQICLLFSTAGHNSQRPVTEFRFCKRGACSWEPAGWIEV